MSEPSRPKILSGVVVESRMQKTALVEVTRFRKVKKYGKYVKRSRRFKVHDEKNEYKVGDKVKIQETRPLSRQKRWTVKLVLERGRGREAGGSSDAGQSL
ncbi:30S ribosomal protein S17 [Candidatus Giovannonibacteria bacterium]|nr:30S ribosomal protein S17 [Candidatus Giovannonibacteria bacterium]